MRTLLGQSPFIIDLRREIESLRQTDAKVLLTGESGVGKEVVARVIHTESRRAHAPIVTVNCASVAETLLESELFGHVKGSFTGADRDKSGLLELANGGTIFLDEVGEMSLRMQALLLRFLENGEIQPVGSLLASKRVDVRVITATNRNLFKGVAEGWFRADLYYRLNVLHIKIPPLRERPEDVEPLANHFLEAFSRQSNVLPPRLPPAVMAHLVEYGWPGNVRELRNIIEGLVARRSGQTVTLDDLHLAQGAASGAGAREEGAGPRPQSLPDQLFDEIVQAGGSFWSVVYPRFLARDLTRDTVRAVVIRGLQQARGNYRILISLFNMPDTDYRRFLAFLRKYDLHQPFHAFRRPQADRPTGGGRLAGSSRSH